MPLNSDEKRLLTFEGFEAEYHRQLRECATAQDAYEKAEHKVEQAIGQRLFSTYDAFRKLQARRLSRQREHTEKSERLSRYLRPRRNEQ